MVFYVIYFYLLKKDTKYTKKQLKMLEKKENKTEKTISWLKIQQYHWSLQTE